MPNWCYNRVTFTHDDPQQITRLINAAKAGKLFNEFYPMPSELLEEAPVGDDYQECSAAIAKRNEEKFGYVGWYDWSIAHWGTKWDISEMDDDDNFTITNDGKTVSFSFDTAWAPPTEWYDNIDGFHIEAYYHEPGMGFCGKWTSEDGDDQYEVNMSEDIDGVKERIPSDILDEFGIIDDMIYYQEESKEEVLEDDGEDWWDAEEALQGIDYGEVTIEIGSSKVHDDEDDDVLDIDDAEDSEEKKE
jgi:hypothetical protein